MTSECLPHCMQVGTFRWMAPEVVRREAYSASADVYSFAMVLVELLTHEVPFATWEACRCPLMMPSDDH